jgi:hypothetical protein
MTSTTPALLPSEEAIRISYGNLALHLNNERSLRIWRLQKLIDIWLRRISAVHRVTGIDHKTIRKGSQFHKIFYTQLT